MDKLSEGRRVFDIEIEALKKTRDALDDTFVRILDMIVSCEGKVVITGIGKPSHIAAKLAATFSSLGTPSFRLHPADAVHGDLGMISENDVVIAISFSGESEEVVRILPYVKMIGARLVGITGNPDSPLAQAADVVQILPKFEEACYMGLAPTSSTTSVLCYGDALAVVASRIYGFSDEDFMKYHPAGSLGKKLILKVDDLMAADERNSRVYENTTLKDAIVELSQKGLGVVSITDAEDHLKGIITDGDLRRQLEKGADIYSLHVRDVMTVTPSTIRLGRLAAEALNIMRNRNISCLPVIDGDRLAGTIRLQDIINAGII